jgi:hypothetical protein
MKARVFLMGTLFLLTLAVAACGLVQESPTGTPPVAQLMPANLPGYEIVQVDSVMDYIKSLSQGGALLSGNVAMVALIERLDGTIACYEEIGAVKAEVFVDEAFPLSTGAIAIVDQNRLTDPANFFRCVVGSGGGIMTEATLEPCSHTYTLERDDNQFHILYLGTTPEICHAFCSNLEGCERH